VKVTVLGSSGTFAGPGQACSGYLVQSQGVSVLMDAGAGTLGELQRHIHLEDLDAVVISHSHPDHWVEAPILFNALRYVLDVGGVPLYSTAETLEMVAGVGHRPLAPTLRPEVIGDGSEFRIGGLTFRCSETDHPPETLGLCVDDGVHRMAYSADTGPAWGFDQFGGSIDLGICEATFREGSGAQDGQPVHMTAAEAGSMARSVGLPRLVITHLLPGADVEGARAEAESTFCSPVEVATTGAVFEI